MDRSLLPFYFPTNVVLVDDDSNFLKHFPLLLDRRLPCRPYNSAGAALRDINNQVALGRTFSEFTNITSLDDTDEHIYVDLTRLHNLVYRDDRFSQITVAIIDYDMPEMDGLDLCRKIQHTEIKKILLTGKADEKVAVEAFNAGLIHQFVQKNNPDVDKHINNAVEKLQLEYFTDITLPIHIALSDKTVSFLTDSTLNEEFSNIKHEHNIVEYYLCGHPKGILMLDDTGNTKFMFVMSDEVLNTHYDMALACEAPAELLNLIKNGNHVPWFPSPDGYYTNDCQSDWQKHLHGVNFTCGKKENYLCALVSPPPLESLDAAKIQPFQTYLKSFDERYSRNS